VPTANLELDENIGLAHPSSHCPLALTRLPRDCGRGGQLQIASRAPIGEPVTPASAWHSPALSQAPQTDCPGPAPVGMAVRGLERLAVCSGHRQTRDRHRLTPQWRSSVLDLEGPPRSIG
jgi:hypothetical protein